MDGKSRSKNGFAWGLGVLLLLCLAVCVGLVVRQEPAPSWECPFALMYEDICYTRFGSEERLALDEMEQVGTVQSCVPSTQMPEENDQTNVELLLNQPIWEKDGFLYIQPGEEKVYWVFSPETSK